MTFRAYKNSLLSLRQSLRWRSWINDKSSYMVQRVENHSIVWLITLPGEIYSDSVSRYVYTVYRAAACDVTGGVTSLNFDATELQIKKI